MSLVWLSGEKPCQPICVSKKSTFLSLLKGILVLRSITKLYIARVKSLTSSTAILAKKKQFYISRHLIERLKSQNTWYAALSLTVSVLRVEYDPVLMRSRKLVSGTEYDLHNYANTSTKSLREFEFSFENSQKFSAVVMWRTCLRRTHFSPSIELDGCTASKTWLLKFKGVV